MEALDALKVFIKTENSVVCCYNRKTKIISDFVYFNGEEMKEEKNYSLQEFRDFCRGFFGATIEIELIHESIRVMISQNNNFDLPFIFKGANDEPVKVHFRGGLIDEDNIAISISTDKNKSTIVVDELTKCVSLDRLRTSAEDLLNKKEEFVLGIIDIDNFNEFNQKYGTVIGDIVLIELATVAKAVLANNGMISRVGGDSFVFYCKVDSDYEKTRNFVFNLKERIKDKINKTLNVNEKVTITIGLSRSFVDSNRFVILYNKALKALERGKKKARNCFIIYFEDKCGSVDDIDRINKIHYEESSTANYSGIAAVVEVLNSNQLFGRRIEETMNLIGTFFMLDRVIIVEYDKTGNSIKFIRQWNNPRSPMLGQYEPTNEEILLRRKFLGDSNLYVTNDISSIPNPKIKKCLEASHTYALVASELRMDDRHFGLIKFEMTSHTRLWQKENIMALNLLAKIISTRYNKEYDAYLHEKQMYFDKETDLYNFHKWFADVSELLKQNETTKKIDKYLVLDMGIMKYNTLANIVGIKVLREILKAISNALKGLEAMNIIYCRSYENRFTLFIPDDDVEFAKRVFKRVLDAIDNVSSEDGEKAKIRAGYYIVDTNTNTYALDEIVERAVSARKKANSINNFLEFNEEMLVVDKFKTMLISHIDVALENNEFVVYLQPKISTKTGDVAGAEALSRWNYNFEKIIFPNDFIPVLEANGYIARLDYKVFENVCIFIKNLESEGKKIIPISVNVSRAIRDFDIYFDNLEKIRKKYDVNPGYIEIEITEGMYSRDNEAIEKFIDMLHHVGYKVSMDDFGSGNSNISTLSQLTFDTIKFDKGFFNDIDNEKEKMIIDTMTKLVKGMNMKVVCEGIETEEYVKYLTKIGADYIQGYFFDKPILIDTFKKKYIN